MRKREGGKQAHSSPAGQLKRPGRPSPTTLLSCRAARRRPAAFMSEPDPCGKARVASACGASRASRARRLARRLAGRARPRLLGRRRAPTQRAGDRQVLDTERMLDAREKAELVQHLLASKSRLRPSLPPFQPPRPCGSLPARLPPVNLRGIRAGRRRSRSGSRRCSQAGGPARNRAPSAGRPSERRAHEGGSRIGGDDQSCG